MKYGQFITEYPTGQGYEVEDLAATSSFVWFFEGKYHYPFGIDVPKEFKEGKIGKITPSGDITLYALPTPKSGKLTDPSDFRVDSKDNLWFIAPQGYKGDGINTPAEIMRFTPNGELAQYKISNVRTLRRLVVGSNGDVWFVGETSNGEDRIGLINANGKVASYQIHGGVPSSSHTGEFLIGADGNLWFPIYNPEIPSKPSFGIAKLTPQGHLSIYPFKNRESAVWSFLSGPDGDIWYIRSNFEGGNYQLGKINTAGKMVEYHVVVPLTEASDELTVGPDGNLWFIAGTEWYVLAIGKNKNAPQNKTKIPKGSIATPLGTITKAPIQLPKTGKVYNPNGSLWGFFEDQSQAIVRVLPNGTTRRYFLGTDYKNLLPYPALEDVVGPDGNIWFATKNGIGKIEIATQTR